MSNLEKGGMFPCPVAVARLSNGAIVRMSFWSKAGRPIDHERGERLVRSSVSRRGERKSVIVWRRFGPVALEYGQPSRRVVAFHVEHDGRIMTRPRLGPVKKPAAKDTAKAALRLIDQLMAGKALPANAVKVLGDLTKLAA